MFKELVAEQFLEYLPDEFRDFGIKLETVRKVNETLDGLAVVPPEGRTGGVFPTVYTNHMYDDYVREGSFQRAMELAADRWADAYKNMPEQCRDFSLSGAGERVIMALVNTGQNREILEGVPHREFHDLSIVYRLTAGSDSTAEYSVLVNNSLACAMGMDEQQLYSAAFINTERMFPPEVRTMKEVLREVFRSEGEPEALADMIVGDPAPDETLYVLSSGRGSFGASVMLYGDSLHEAAERTGTDLYILPSSIHEVLAVSTSMGSAQDMKSMVSSVNLEQVSPEDRLSDNVYHYDRISRVLSPAVSEKLLEGIAAASPPAMGSQAKYTAGHSR